VVVAGTLQQVLLEPLVVALAEITQVPLQKPAVAEHLVKVMLVVIHPLEAHQAREAVAGPEQSV
jgi:hypothetical protein